VMRSFTEPSTESGTTSIGKARRLSDESLVEAAKLGHSIAFDTLSERYRQQLFRAAHRITRSREDAEDAVQDSLLRAFVHMRNFDGRSKLGTWLTRIAINSALMILRKKRASPEIATDSNDNFDADGLRYEISDHVPNPEKRYAQSEEESMLKKAIQRLRPTLRVVVQIQQLQERSMRETAEAIGISLTAAKGRLFHAKNALRRSLIPKLAHPPRFATGFAFCPHGNGSSRAKARMRFNDQQQSNHKEEGDEYVIENKEERKYRVPSNLHPSGDGRGFERELGA
jgi:RNA polymerase sigma factor (sigma-70 family)